MILLIVRIRISYDGIIVKDYIKIVFCKKVLKVVSLDGKGIQPMDIDILR